MCVVHAQRYLHPCGCLTHTTHNMQQTRYTPYEDCLQVSWHTSSVLHYANFATKDQHRQQCCVVPTITQHNARHCMLHIAAMIQRNDTRWCNSGTCILNNLCTTALLERGGKARRWRSRSRSWRSRLKIEIDAEFSRSSIQTIGVKIDLCESDLDLGLQHWLKNEMFNEFYKKLKNVSCEYDCLNGWNSTLQAAWYIRHVRSYDVIFVN